MNALILTTHTGGGHDAAARAVSEALEARGVRCRTMDCVAFAGRRISRIVSGTYVAMARRTPGTFGRIYHLSEHISRRKHKSVVYAANASYAFRMRRTLESFQPAMVICTHQFGGQSMTSLRRRGRYRGLLCMVMTDYTYSPFMEDIEADILTVSHPDVIPECLARGVPEKTLWTGGIPVSPSCVPCTDKAAAKAKLGLPAEGREVLLVGGSMGAGRLPEKVRLLLSTMDARDHLSVICGSNRKALEEISLQFAAEPRVTALGRVQPLYDRIAAADIVVTKTGGLTSTEVMTIGAALVASDPIEGCETANAALLERHGMAVWPRTEEALRDAVRDLLRDENKRLAMIRSQRIAIEPDCAGRLAELLIRRVEAGEDR